MKIVLLVVMVLLLFACSVFQTLAGEVASGVVRYCEQPYDARVLVRQGINVELASYGHKVHVHCAGDPNTSNLARWCTLSELYAENGLPLSSRVCVPPS